ncbi:transporter substrate-binding domain-containing protein [Skermanella mucosa]|uniref:substrate-binding periplasmic protein n=1 Tax=Skermanella mucosa TaxID=1789672 RepID=UPI00192CC3D6|nr:transporter substrate-binding domain-containing protein [Skermanella mucosa]UEM20029.1 transporter substrate-binding domain-containing protein [Skermanella mucosa]
MARSFKLLRLVLLLCLPVLMPLPEPAAALDLVNIVLAPLPPFIVEGMPPDRPQGLVTDILSEAFRRDGRSARYTYMPASRAEHTVRNGRAFATVIWGGFGRDARDFVLSESLLEASVSAFVGTGYSGPPLDSFPAIAALQLDGPGRLRVIAIHGDPVQDSLVAAGVEIEDVPSIASALTLVVRAQGRVVLVTFTDPVLLTAQESGVAPSAFLEFPIRRTEFRLAIARSRAGAAGLVERFDEALASMREDGSIDAIRARYVSFRPPTD